MMRVRGWLLMSAWIGMVIAYRCEVFLADLKPEGYAVGMVVLQMAFNMLLIPVVSHCTYGYWARREAERSEEEFDKEERELAEALSDLRASVRTMVRNRTRGFNANE
jgi:hypothetical protein